MNCPACDQAMSRRLYQRHYECACGSIFIPHATKSVRDSLCGLIQGLAKNHGMAFKGTDPVRGGVTVAQALDGVGNAIQTLGAVLKGFSDGEKGVGLCGHEGK